MTSHGQCPRGGCLWMSKSGGVFQIDDVTRTMSKGGGAPGVPPIQVQTPPTWLAGYGPVGICHTSKVILPHVLENTSLVLVSPPLHNALCRDRKFECNYICKFSGMYVSWQGAYPH